MENQKYVIPENQIEKIPVASQLTDTMYKIFLSVYAKHNRSMGLEERAKYTLSDITKVEVNIEDNCLNVHYADGEWWKYTLDGRWY